MPQLFYHNYPAAKKLVGPRVSLDAVAKRKNPFPAPAGNQTPVIQPIAWSLY